MPERPIDLNMLAMDIAEVLDKHHDVEVSSREVMRGLVPFIDIVAPGRLTDEQRFGVGG